MSIKRYAARADVNQAKIVDMLRKLGFSVEIIGMPSDLLIAKNGTTVVIEVKNPDQSPSKRRLTDQEREFYESWQGLYAVIETQEECLSLKEAFSMGAKAVSDWCSINMKDHFGNNYKPRA